MLLLMVTPHNVRVTLGITGIVSDCWNTCSIILWLGAVTVSSARVRSALRLLPYLPRCYRNTEREGFSAKVLQKYREGRV
jgi:hypothetical protein